MWRRPAGRLLAAPAVLLAAAILFASAPPARTAEQRVALVIGNGAYEDVPRLPNAPNDATLVAETLRGLGFEVIERTDASRRDMMKAIKTFGDRLTAAGTDGVGLFYYAGHGVQAGGVNYLIPLAAEIADESDLDIEAVSANAVLGQMEWAGTGLNLVILDACRNNPYESGFRSMTRGLARMLAPRGSLISYATEPGGVAADGDGANSPYAIALARAMTVPGLPVEQVFKRVRRDVLVATASAQTTWESSSLTGDFYFVPAVEGAPEPVVAPAPSEDAAEPMVDREALFWSSIKGSDNPTMFEQYLAQFPGGVFAGLADARLEELRSQGTETAALAPAPEPAWEPPEVEPVDADFTVVKNANVRAEPSIRADILDTLPLGSTVLVAGKVRGANWYLVALPDGREGYVFGRLLAPYEETVALAPAPAAPEAEPDPQPAESGQPIFNIKPVRHEDERVVGVTEVIQYGLAKALDARVVLDWPFEADETTVTGKITMLDVSKKEDLEYYGSELAQALLGSLGSSLSQSISPSTGIYEVKVRLVAENQRTGQTAVEEAHVVILRDGRMDVEQSTNYAINKAFAEATQRLATRLNGGVPEPLIEATIYDEYKRDRPAQERPTEAPLDSR